jgi:hypothetical protein
VHFERKLVAEVFAEKTYFVEQRNKIRLVAENVQKYLVNQLGLKTLFVVSRAQFLVFLDRIMQVKFNLKILKNKIQVLVEFKNREKILKLLKMLKNKLIVKKQTVLSPLAAKIVNITK